jgi:pimeloyl-ACP methyl ester carboxylesterase
MTTATATALADKYVTIDGLKIRYLEAGSGPALIFLHGGSLGSSADVFRRNLPSFAAHGFRAIAFDYPGFGLSDTPADHSTAYRRSMITKFQDTLGLKKVALMAHSQAGGFAVPLALAEPNRYSHVVIMGTGSLLPPADDVPQKERAAEAESAELKEPTIEDTRKLLEWNLFHHELITPEELALRHKNSIGKAFEAALARARSDASKGNKAKGGGKEEVPMWKRLIELKMPLLLIYGRQDRSWAALRAEKLKRLHPELDLQIVDGCKHLVPWDIEDELLRLSVEFLKRKH